MRAAAAGRGLHIARASAEHAQPEAGNLAASLARVRGADIEYYAPVSVDLQKPHARDEIYIIAAGSGTLTVGADSFAVSSGDVLYVPAHVEHRFANFTDDFATWVVFYGPEYPA